MSVVDDIESLKRSNMLAIKLHQSAESDVTTLIKQMNDLLTLYTKVALNYLTTVPDNDGIHKLTHELLIQRMKDSLMSIIKLQEERVQLTK